MIIVGMSGGVDSSVAALLLKRAGEDVRGIFMDNWEDDTPGCRAAADRADALRVCSHLGIPFQAVSHAATYRARVFEQFLADYAAGRTPNPDVLCNREVKFAAFLDQAIALGADRLATGHYARREKIGNRFGLFRAADPSKDQSYFLQAISQAALDRAEFPLGDLAKHQVREIARQAGLLTAAKKDSTGICFIGEQDFKTFLARYLPAGPGSVLDESGREIGQHAGALYYTIGQRAPVGGVRGSTGGSWFVLEKDVARNVLIAGQGAEHPRLMATGLATDPNAHWIAGAPPARQFRALVQLRHLAPAEPASITVADDGSFQARFDQPQRAVAPGQAAAVYCADQCLGGGFIAKAL